MNFYHGFICIYIEIFFVTCSQFFQSLIMVLMFQEDAGDEIKEASKRDSGDGR